MYLSAVYSEFARLVLLGELMPELVSTLNRKNGCLDRVGSRIGAVQQPSNATARLADDLMTLESI